MSLPRPSSEPETPNKHQQKTEVTKRRLLKAAFRVFARDGFEASSIDDIAASGGYTRGAFYANFPSKEDLFFALMEDQSRAHMEAIKDAMQGRTTRDARLEALRSYYIGKLADRRWSILMVEFKLYALRHPKLRAKLAATHRSMRDRLKWESVIGMQSGETAEDNREVVRIALQVLLHGLVLERAYDPATLSEKQGSSLLGRIFDFLLTAEQSEKRAVQRES